MPSATLNGSEPGLRYGFACGLQTYISSVIGVGGERSRLFSWFGSRQVGVKSKMSCEEANVG